MNCTRHVIIRQAAHLATMAICLAVTTPALANEVEASRPAIDLGASVAASSDYVWRGLTQTGGQPAAFATVTASLGGFYAGVGTENVDFGGIKQEYDLWGGYIVDLGAIGMPGTKLDLGLSFYGYVDAPDPIDTLEVKAAITSVSGRMTYGVSGYYTRNYFGTGAPAAYGEIALGYQLTDRLSANGVLGHQQIDALPDYTTWNAGATYDLGHGLKMDLRYHDSNATGVGTTGGSRLAGTLTMGF